MTTAKYLRELAARLLAHSVRAREDGRVSLADQLTERASDYLDRARTAEVQRTRLGPQTTDNK
jgi:hypothetical protein